MMNVLVNLCGRIDLTFAALAFLIIERKKNLMSCVDFTNEEITELWLETFPSSFGHSCPTQSSTAPTVSGNKSINGWVKIFSLLHMSAMSKKNWLSLTMKNLIIDWTQVLSCNKIQNAMQNAEECIGWGQRYYLHSCSHGKYRSSVSRVPASCVVSLMYLYLQQWHTSLQWNHQDSMWQEPQCGFSWTSLLPGQLTVTCNSVCWELTL